MWRNEYLKKYNLTTAFIVYQIGGNQQLVWMNNTKVN